MLNLSRFTNSNSAVSRSSRATVLKKRIRSKMNSLRKEVAALSLRKVIVWWMRMLKLI